MADTKAVKFKITLDGVEALKRELCTISNEAKKMAEDYLKFEARKTAATERETKKREREYGKMFAGIEKKEKDATKATQKELSKREAEYGKMFDVLEKNEKKAETAHQKHLDNMTKADMKHTANYERQQEKKFAALKREINKEEALAKRASGGASGGSKGPNPFGISGLGHIAQAAGFYRVGHLLRAGGMLNVGSESGMGVGQAAALGAAFGGVVIASKLVEMGFHAVAQTATALVGAVSQIGGARNLQEMLVESASAEKLSAGISANSTDKMTTQNVLKNVNRISRNSEFDPKEIAEGMRAYVGKTGSAQGFADIGNFAGKLASVSGMGMSQTGGLLGQLQTQFGLNAQDTKMAAMNLWKQGTAGTVELKDTQQVTEALGFSRKAGNGNVMKGMGLEMGLVQLAQKGMGGQSAAEAVTAVRRFQEDLTNRPGLRSALGATMGTDANGNATFTDLKGNMAKAALMELQHPGMLKGFGVEERGLRVPRSIGEYAAQTTAYKGAKSDSEKQKVISDIIEQFSDAKDAVKDFNKAFTDVSGTAEFQLKQTFNDLAVVLEEEFLPIIKGEIVPAIKNFATTIKEHKDEIAKWVEQVAGLMMTLAASMPPLLVAFANAAEWIMSIAGVTPDQKIANAQGGMTYAANLGASDLYSPEERGRLINEKMLQAKKDLELYVPMRESMAAMKSGAAAISGGPEKSSESGGGGTNGFNDSTAVPNLAKVLQDNVKATEANTKALQHGHSNAPSVSSAGRGNDSHLSGY